MNKQTSAKIGFIGPVLPWRGGISKYSSWLVSEFRALAYIRATSFKSLYPGFLYPGESSVEPGAEKDQSIHYLIAWYSPLSWYRAYKEQRQSETVFIDWWTLFWQPALSIITFMLRRKGVRVVYVCHNVVDHDASGITAKITRSLLKRADGYVVHSREQVEALKELNPEVPVLYKIMPIFNEGKIVRSQSSLNNELRVLFFGFIRPYKGLDDLMEAMRIVNDPNIKLTVVGEPWQDKQELLDKLESYGIKNATFQLSYADDKQRDELFSNTDIVALPYKSATGSAVAALAHGYGKPVLATSVGGLVDAIEEGKTGWLVPPEDPKGLAEAIKRIDKRQLQGMTKVIQLHCKKNSWNALASDMIETFATGKRRVDG